jgi:hypothetical protein
VVKFFIILSGTPLKKSVFCFVSVFCFLFFSCLSSEISTKEWHPAQNLDELYGTWVSTKGEYTYPLEIGGKKYLRFALVRTEDTQKWKEYAELNEIDLSDLWNKRFALSRSIYSTPDKTENYPEADENGTQKGRKLFLEDEKIYSREEILIPENILAINLNFFLIRKDGMSFREQGIFHLISQKFPDSRADEAIYYSMGGAVPK